MKNLMRPLNYAFSALALAGLSATLGAVTIGEVRLLREGGSTIVKVAADAATAPTLEQLEGKVVLKVPGGKRARLSEIKLKHPLLSGVRFGQHEADLHIVLDLAKAASARLRAPGKSGFEVELKPSPSTSPGQASAAPEDRPREAAKAAEASEAPLASLDPALAGYTYRLVDVALAGDEEHSEVVLSTDGPASYKPVVRQGGKALIVVFKNCSLAWSGDPGILVDAAVDSVKVKGTQVKGEAQVEVSVALSEKLAYTIHRDQNQVVLRIQRPEREVAAPKRGDLETPVSLEVEDADIVGVLKGLCQEVGFDYQISKDLLSKSPPESLVTLKATKRPLREVLDTLLIPMAMQYAQQGNTLFMGPSNEISAKKGLVPSVQKSYEPKNMSAAQLKAILDAYYKRSPELGDQENTYFEDPRNKQRFLLVGSPQDVASVMATIARYDVPEEGEASAGEAGSDGGGGKRTQVFKLQYIDANSMAFVQNALEQLYPSQADATENLSVKMDPNTRTLVITTQLKYLRKIEKLISRLDIQPPQVNIEGKIVEVDFSTADQLGVQWGAARVGSNGVDYTAGEFRSNISDIFTSQLRMGIFQGTLGLEGTLSALVEQAKANILSSPNITTSDNVQARFITSDNVIVTTLKEDIQPGGTINRTVTEQEYPIPLRLEVTPRISMADKKIIMKIFFTLKTPTGAARLTGLVPNTEQTADTQVTVTSGETAVIGGLTKQSDLDTERKVPVLGDIPLIGLLFKYKSTNNKKSEVVIFITPTIVEN